MAFSGIMCTEAEIDQKSGANVSTAYTDTMKTAAVLQGESLVNLTARKNLSDDFSTLNTDVKGLINDIVSSFVAIQAVSYDMSGYASGRTEAENIINILRDGMLRNLAILRGQKVKTFQANA